jgi:hypothetical protein
MAATERSVIQCREESVLAPEEKKRFEGFFQEYGLSEDIFLFFESLVGLSTEQERFIFVKAFLRDELVGLAMFARIAGYSLYGGLNAGLRKHALLARVAGMMRSTVYFSMHSVSSPGLPRSFLSTDKDLEDGVNQAILSWAKQKRDANTVIIFDAADASEVYARNSFACLPFTSDSWLEVPRYETVDDYLRLHKPTRKKLSRFSKRQDVEVEILRGKVPEETMSGIIACLICSYRHSKGLLPIQEFFNANLLRTALFTSDRFIHFVIRVDGQVAGFSTRLCCGKSLIGIIGGYDRDLPGKLPVYDFMVATTLDFCIRNQYTRLVFGLVDNHTKARLMDSFREQKFYLYSRNPLLRALMKWAYRFMSAHDLHRIDAEAREGREERRQGRSAPGR